MSAVFSSDEVLLPPLVIESIQRAFDKGTFLSTDSRFGYFLPCPHFPRVKSKTARPSAEPYQLHVLQLQAREEQSCCRAERSLHSKQSNTDSHVLCSFHNQDKGTEWNISGNDEDYSSDLSSPSTSTGKKTRKIILTCTQAKEVSIVLACSCMFAFQTTHHPCRRSTRFALQPIMLPHDHCCAVGSRRVLGPKQSQLATA
jgi:hypothetical protein